MLRSSLIAASAVLLCGAATAQESSPLNWSVIQGKPKFGGTYHLMTGKWTRQPGLQQLPSRTEGTLTRVYDNTCLWTGSAPNTVTFNGMEACEDIYDNGRIPGVASGVVGATDDNLIEAVSFGHVTFAMPGMTDIELGFYDTLGGTCAGFASPNPPAPAAAGYLNLDPGNGITLPGDPTGGGTTWLLTIDLSGGGEFCLISEGDGTMGSGTDEFNWKYTHNTPSSMAGTGGPIIAGEPIRGTFGACTYSIACGTDPIIGPCGTGLASGDAFWQNVGGDPAGPAGSVNTSLTCTLAATGTGCFFFGGWPGNPWSSYFMALDSAGPCMTVPPSAFYCTGKTTSSGCIPFLTTSAGNPSVSGGGWQILSLDHLAGEAGFGIYSPKKSNLNFHGGKLCVKAPFIRTAIAKTVNTTCINPFGGCTTTACRTLKRNFGATVQGGLDPTLTAGAVRRFQMRQRDPSEPQGFGDNLSDGVVFTIIP